MLFTCSDLTKTLCFPFNVEKRLLQATSVCVWGGGGWASPWAPLSKALYFTSRGFYYEIMFKTYGQFG